MWMCSLPHGASLPASTYLEPGKCPRCGLPMYRVTDALASAALVEAKESASAALARVLVARGRWGA